MNFDGAWRAVYAETLWGEGLVILRRGRVLGCDKQYFYEGDYSVSDDGRFTGKIHVEHYAGEARSIFHRSENVRLVDYWADLEGGIDADNVLRLEAKVVLHDGLWFQIALVRWVP